MPVHMKSPLVPGVVRGTLHGTVSESDLESLFIAIQPDAGAGLWSDSVWDLCTVSEFRIRFQEMVSIRLRWIKLLQQSGKPRLAFVYESDLQSGVLNQIANVFGMFLTIECFKNRDDAARWLNDSNSIELHHAG
ncbi:hypothetical protein GF324_10380 [bacterium]|nr:hypothetical protein [bacterium]